MKRLFLSVGSRGKGFDRLVKTLDRLLANGKVSAEVEAELGATRYRPSQFKGKKQLTWGQRRKRIQQADIVVCDADPEVVVPALAMEKPVVVMPRLRRWGETRSDQQLLFARALEHKGKVLLAEETHQLLGKLNDTRHFVPWVGAERPRLVIRLVLFLQKARF